MDERGLDIEKTEHRVLDGERIRDERAANRRGARFEAYGRGQIREAEERPLIPSVILSMERTPLARLTPLAHDESPSGFPAPRGVPLISLPVGVTGGGLTK